MVGGGDRLGGREGVSGGGVVEVEGGDGRGSCGKMWRKDVGAWGGVGGRCVRPWGRGGGGRRREGWGGGRGRGGGEGE